MASKMEMEVELKSSADKFWETMTEANTLLPKIFPNIYKSIEILQGDGKSIGSVRLVKYTEEVPNITFGKEKIELADEASKTVGYSVIDGELINYYKNFKATFQVIPKGEGSAVKGSFEYEKANAEVPEPEALKKMTEQTFKDLDAYVIKN